MAIIYFISICVVPGVITGEFSPEGTIMRKDLIRVYKGRILLKFIYVICQSSVI